MCLCREKSIVCFDNDGELSACGEDIDTFYMHPMGHRLDVKYELFLKWLQCNEMADDVQSVDEFISQVSDDDDDDYVDTETDYPLISLSKVNAASVTKPEPDECQTTIYSKLLSADSVNNLCSGDSTGNATPSLLSVTSLAGYDSSTSDISGISENTKLTKRKAKHNKGKAPPIPLPLSVQLMQENIDSETTAPDNAPVHIEEKKTILNFIPGLFRSKSPVNNLSGSQIVDDGHITDDKFETHIHH